MNVGPTFFDGTAGAVVVTSSLVKLLIHADGSVVDSGPIHMDVTSFGNAAASGTQKKFGSGAIALDGTGDYVTGVPFVGLYRGSGGLFCLECWFYVTDTGTVRGIMCIAGSVVGNPDALWYVVRNADNKLHLLVGNAGSAFYRIDGATTVTANAWHHLALIGNVANQQLVLDGVSQGTFLSASGGTQNWDYNWLLHQVEIGNTFAATPALGNYFLGYIDEVVLTIGSSVYTAPFTPPAAPYADTIVGQSVNPPGSSLVLMAHLDGTNGATSWTDSCSHAHSISRVGSTVVSSAMRFFGGNSTFFDGTGDILQIADGADWTFGTGDFTVELWAHFTGTGVRSLIGSAIGTGFYPFNIFYTGSALQANVSYSDSTTSVLAGTVGTFTSNVWHHVAVTRSGNTFYFFIDGVEVGPGSRTVSSKTLWDAAAPLCIGNYSVDHNAGAGSGACWQGYMRELRICKYALYTANFTRPSTIFPDS